MKYIFITGGVVSSVGKGITTASLGRLLINRGLKVMALKIDPYINVDAGTMNPFQHGEVFVTNDGAETDLDLGHYERFLGIDLNRNSNLTSGIVYRSVIEKERRGDYLGQTVQLIPHITDEIKNRIYQLGKESGADVLLTEIGGTIGDFEMPPFVEAIKQIGIEVGEENALYIHVSLVISLGPWGESKSKATQHSVRELLGLGIEPDILICRAKHTLSDPMLKKISSRCGVSLESVIEATDTKNIYEIPLNLEKQELADIALKKLNMGNRGQPNNSEWVQMVEKMKGTNEKVNIAIVGKYVRHGDAYISVKEALKHAGIANNTAVNIKWVDSEKTEEKDDLAEQFEDISGIVVPGGFGDRGIEGKITAIKYLRERKIPFLGLCLGLHCMVIEFARNVAGLENANSSEFAPDTPYPVIDLLPEQKQEEEMGGTMRLGSQPCKLIPDTLAYQSYKQEVVCERHRHRYEFNDEYRELLTEKGLRIGGVSQDKGLVEILEIQDHPWMLATQFHPEFKSRPLEPHPLFSDFIKASLKYRAEK